MAFTLNDNVPRVQYAVGATPSTGPFTIPYEFFDGGDIDVIVDDGTTVTTFIDETGFSVTGTASDDGLAFESGQVDLDAAVSNVTVTVIRNLAIDRLSQQPTAGKFKINSLNTSLSRAFAIMQELRLDLDRAFRLLPEDPSDLLVLPDASGRANKFLAFDGAGDPIAVEVVAGTGLGVPAPADPGDDTKVLTANSGTFTWELPPGSTFDHFVFTASAAQTVFTGADDNANTLAFTSNNVLIFLNGVLLIEGASNDYTVSGGNTVTLVTGANLNDVLTVFTLGAIVLADAFTQTQGDARYVVQSNNLSDLGDDGIAFGNLSPDTLVAGDTFYWDGTDLKRVAKGTASQVWTMNVGATAPEWQDAPGGGSGALQQVAIGTSTSNHSTTSNIPFDNSVPQITEGIEITTATITPTNASSTLIIEYGGLATGSSNGMFLCMAIFVDATSAALDATAVECDSSMRTHNMHGCFTVSAGSTTARTYRLRFGDSGGGTARLNMNDTGGSLFGAAGPTAYLKVTEVLP